MIKAVTNEQNRSKLVKAYIFYSNLLSPTVGAKMNDLIAKIQQLKKEKKAIILITITSVQKFKT